METKRLLFLCTGNCYRSRLAEELFNHCARDAQMDWRAFSRGLALERGTANVGPISPFTLQALAERAVSPLNVHAYPAACTLGDLQTADLVVAVKEAEHREILALKFPGWQDKVRYWHVHDIEDLEPSLAVAILEQNVNQLILNLREGRV